MDLDSLLSEKYKRSPHGSAHSDPGDAYRGVPILKKPVWKNEVAAYFFFGGLSAGSALLGSVLDLVGGQGHRKLAHAAHYVSFAAFLPCPPLLIDDLGVPSKFYHMLRIFKPSSPMNLGSWAFAVHGAGATAMVMRMLAGDGKLPAISKLVVVVPERLLAALSIPSSLLLAGYTGVLLGTTSIPVWYTSRLLGALFTASSFSTGAAALEVAASASGIYESGTAKQMATFRVIADVATLATYAGYVKTSGSAASPLWTGERRMLNVASFLTLGVSLVGGLTALTGQTGKVSRVVMAMSGLVSGALLRWAIVRAGRVSADDREGTLRAMTATPRRRGWIPPSGGSAGQESIAHA